MSAGAQVGPINPRYLDELLPDLDLFTTVVDMFCLQAPRLLDGLERAIADNDRQTAAQLAHDLASTSGQVGAGRVSDLARDLEQLADQGAGDLAEGCAQVARQLPEALTELQRIRAAYVSSNR